MADYVQEDDPGAVGAFKTWGKVSTGALYVRNSSNTNWTIDKVVSENYCGIVPKIGGTMADNITGVTGFSSLTDQDFNDSSRLDFINLATSGDLSKLNSAMLQFINLSVLRYMNEYQGKISVSNGIAVGSGILDFTSYQTSNLNDIPYKTIPLPFFASDGVQATEVQCKWFVSPIYLRVDLTSSHSSSADLLFYPTNPLTSRSLKAYVQAWDGVKNGIKVFYLIVATR